MRISLPNFFHWRKTASENPTCPRAGNPPKETDIQEKQQPSFFRAHSFRHYRTRPFLLFAIILLAATTKGMAQNYPGGISGATAPTIWYNPANYASATWPNNGTFTGCDLTNSGSQVYNSGDKASNYNPYVYYVFVNTTTLGSSSTNSQVSYSNAISASQATQMQQHTTFSSLLLTNLSNSATHAPSVFRFTDLQYVRFTDLQYGGNHGYSIAGYNEGLPYCYVSGFYNNASGYVNEIGLGTVDTFSYRPVILAMQPQAATSTTKFNFGLNGHYRMTTNSYNGPGYNGGAPSATTYRYIVVGRGYYYGMEGRVSDQIVYAGALSNNQIYEVESYLGIKQGITLAHPYYAASPDGTTLGTVLWNIGNTGGYDNNVAGIGREALNGNLDQRQSNSSNTGNQVLIGTTGLANNNTANSVDLAADGQYLLWGDNGLAKVPTKPITGVGAANYRFAAVWTAQNTGSVGTIRVAWPTGLTNLTLVQSSDPTFASGNTATNMSANTVTINGTAYNYADVILSSGQYFTFAATVFSPGGITTLPAVWYKPDGVSATAWTDASLSGLNLTAIGAPTVTAGDATHNFNTWTTGYSSSKYYSYTGSNYSVFGGSAGSTGVGTPINTPLTVFGVARATSAAAGEITGIDNDATYGAEPGFGVQVSGSSLYPYTYRFTNGITQTASTGPTVTLGQASVYTYQPPPGTSGTGNLIMGLNGTQTTISGVSATSSVVGSSLKIGYDGWNLGAFSGDIQEVVWFKSTLSASDISKVETYLALKSGTTLTHDYVDPNGNTLYSLSTNSGYTSNIAGLARDMANGNIDQRQSNSINTGKQVLIGTIGLANNNATNTTDLSADGQYLVWGDNGGAKRLTTAFSDNTGGVSANYRFGAVWKVGNTGSVGTVRVAWPAGINNLKLVTNPSDPTFASGNTVTNIAPNTITLNGVTYSYADVTLADGSYFTFAGSVASPGGVAAAPAFWFRADMGTNTTTAGTNNLTAWTEINKTTTATTTVINTAGGATSYPSYGTTTSFFNFNPYADFTTTSQSIGDPNATPLSGATAADQFSVTYMTSYSGSGVDSRLFSMNYDPAPTTYDIYTYDYLADNGSYLFNRAGAITSSNPTHASDNYYATSTTYRTSNLSNIIKYSISLGATSLGVQANGNTAATIANNGGSTGLLVPFGGYIMGSLGASYTNGFGNSNGNVFKSAENVLFSRALTTDETQRVNSYLAIRYGITLGGNNASGASYNYLNSLSTPVWTNTSNTGFLFNVVGIARDDNSLLQQQISASSAATKDIITIGTDANSTGANGTHTAISADKSYFMVGSNNGSISNVNTQFTYRGVPCFRMLRVWKYQYTNFNQAAYITVPTSNLVTSLSALPAGQSYGLATADDANFTTNVQVSALSTSGSNSYGSITPSATGARYFTFVRLSSTVLPVTLLDITATPVNGSVLLSWRTATEINNKGFGVQRSTDGSVFTTLGFVDTKVLNGTGSGTDYTYTDNTVTGGAYYYRLLQTDLDGKTSTSKAVQVYLSGNGDELKLYPNPVNDVATVSGLEVGKSVVIISMDGRVVKTFIATASLQQVYMKGFASGVYILKTTVNNNSVNIKFVVK